MSINDDEMSINDDEININDGEININDDEINIINDILNSISDDDNDIDNNIANLTYLIMKNNKEIYNIDYNNFIIILKTIFKNYIYERKRPIFNTIDYYESYTGNFNAIKISHDKDVANLLIEKTQFVDSIETDDEFIEKYGILEKLPIFCKKQFQIDLNDAQKINKCKTL